MTTTFNSSSGACSLPLIGGDGDPSGDYITANPLPGSSCQIDLACSGSFTASFVCTAPSGGDGSWNCPRTGNPAISGCNGGSGGYLTFDAEFTTSTTDPCIIGGTIVGGGGGGVQNYGEADGGSGGAAGYQGNGAPNWNGSPEISGALTLFILYNNEELPLCSVAGGGGGDGGASSNINDTKIGQGGGGSSFTIGTSNNYTESINTPISLIIGGYSISITNIQFSAGVAYANTNGNGSNSEMGSGGSGGSCVIEISAATTSTATSTTTSTPAPTSTATSTTADTMTVQPSSTASLRATTPQTSGGSQAYKRACKQPSSQNVSMSMKT